MTVNSAQLLPSNAPVAVPACADHDAPGPVTHGEPSQRCLLSEQEIRAFSRDLRILLATNGTLTRILSVLIDEEVAVRVLEQTIETRSPELPQFEAFGDSRVLRRKVILEGKVSERPFVAADSSIAIDLLPSSVEANLKQTKRPIGEIMASSHLELFKEKPEFWMGDTPGWAVPAMNHALRQKTVGRRYRMIIEGQPAVVVSEYFPLDLF
ncbi:Chorismate--pyruvate lyase [Mycobacterium basiliense]|uniref:Chorismate--pyruvate lyase n=1 Tax=Mycobacterium basiliense TaxID=2094119 RepID=A0A3S4C9L9_9MYCO|nr:chorismate lyase [Mycobacterium basiliense]VDM87539.1 Chorismate--pyruvate lyase [Mycobacterium basiliense]